LPEFFFAHVNPIIAYKGKQPNKLGRGEACAKSGDKMGIKTEEWKPSAQLTV